MGSAGGEMGMEGVGGGGGLEGKREASGKKRYLIDGILTRVPQSSPSTFS